MPMPKRKPGIKKCARCEKAFEFGGRGIVKRERAIFAIESQSV